MRRFDFFDRDGAILRHANRIKLDLMADDDGVAMSFEIHGSVWPSEADGDGNLNCKETTADAAELAGDLLGKFLAAKGGPR